MTGDYFSRIPQQCFWRISVFGLVWFPNILFALNYLNQKRLFHFLGDDQRECFKRGPGPSHHCSFSWPEPNEEAHVRGWPEEFFIRRIDFGTSLLIPWGKWGVQTLVWDRPARGSSFCEESILDPLTTVSLTHLRLTRGSSLWGVNLVLSLLTHLSQMRSPGSCRRLTKGSALWEESILGPPQSSSWALPPHWSGSTSLHLRVRQSAICFHWTQVYNKQDSHWLLLCTVSCFELQSVALYRKSDLCIPRKETARPPSQFFNLCICEQFLYSQDRSTYLAAERKVDRYWEYTV